MTFEFEMNKYFAREVADEARRRKKMKPNGTIFVASQSEMRKDVDQNIKYRNRKLAELRLFLDVFDEAGRPVEMESTVTASLKNVFKNRVNKPDDQAMWLIVESELEVRGLLHLVPNESEEVSI